MKSAFIVLLIVSTCFIGCYRPLEDEDWRHFKPLRKRLYGEWEMVKVEIPTTTSLPHW